MKLYPKLMSTWHIEKNAWSLFVDVECTECDKNQSLVNYRTNGDKCINCGSEIKL